MVLETILPLNILIIQLEKKDNNKIIIFLVHKSYFSTKSSAVPDFSLNLKKYYQ